jgi:hemolysin activation/secretion protein
LIFSNTPAPALTNYTGASVGRDQIVQAAADVLFEYQKRGFRKANISIAEDQITNGIVTMHVYQGVFPQVLISGKPCFDSSDAAVAALLAAGTRATNAAAAAAAAEPRLNVLAYEITGDTLLSTNTLMSIFVKATGTNVPFSAIKQAAADLQMEYRNRGYPTVSVVMPGQVLSPVQPNLIKIHVFEGRLSEISVFNNSHFSSNNVMRALPSLQTNLLLRGPVFQAELDRANANQDRQIYPMLESGTGLNTTDLRLRVEDRLPLHAKIELNNQNSPGTPDLRINTSAAYNNLWQLEHSLGVQYGFSPEGYKVGDWNFFDRPLVANYGGFYRMPIGEFSAIEPLVTSGVGNFGYDEATRQFRLPSPSGQPELNFFASRSTIDTGLMTVYSALLYNTNGNSLHRQDVQQDLTINSDVGARFSMPIQTSATFRSGVSGGFDYKSYELTSSKTNIFTLTSEVLDTISNPGHTITNINVSTIYSPLPTVTHLVDYLPLSLHYDASLHDARGVTAFGLGLGANLWYSGSESELQSIAGSKESTGHWVTLTPSLLRDFSWRTNWVLSFRADGQWTSEPLISNEQYGLGGLNTVRGYHEGEVFGDNGWHISLEQKTPPYLIGMVYPGHYLTVRGTVYMDYGEAILLDPQGRPPRTELWGTGFGGVATVGATWEARFLFSLPLLSAGSIEAYQPRMDFSLSAQF